MFFSIGSNMLQLQSTASDISKSLVHCFLYYTSLIMYVLSTSLILYVLSTKQSHEFFHFYVYTVQCYVSFTQYTLPFTIFFINYLPYFTALPFNYLPCFHFFLQLLWKYQNLSPFNSALFALVRL